MEYNVDYADQTEISSKEMFIDGQVPMRNGRICDHDHTDADLDSPGEHRGAHHNGLVTFCYLLISRDRINFM